MKKRITALVSGAVVLVVSSFVFAVGAPEAVAASTAEKQHGGTFKLIRYTGPGRGIGWGPNIGRTDRTDGICALESFLRIYLDLRMEPMLATSWKIAPNRGSVTFNLRKGVKFHDGTDWNAEAAKFNLEAFKAAKKPEARRWTAIKVIDDYTVQVDLSEWQNTVLEDIGTVLMVSPAAFKAMGKEKINWHPVGTGPFKFVSLDRDVATIYEKFNDYWQKGKPYVDRIELIVIKDPVTQEASMEAGEADALYSPNLKVGADLKARGFESIYRHDGTFSLMPDSANPDSPFADKRVREALEYAIDRPAIMKALGQGFWEPAYQFACPYNKGYISDFKGRGYDPAKAKSLLKDAGHSAGFKTKIIIFPGTSREIMAAVQGYLAQVGIQAELEFPDMGKYMQARRKGWSNALMAAPWSIYANLGRTLTTYAATFSGDYVKLKRPAGIDKLVEEVVATVEIEAKKVEEVVRIWSDEAVAIPLWHIGAPRSLKAGVVHDTGFLAFASNYDWAPENVWLSK
ncbi:MAG: ABC transporter substrate-binding protein [Deltaproteobacteria bacterium]|nr:MAG: ABC transporter substrate-binding protein [Deltaproteobacteria bacterium]